MQIFWHLLMAANAIAVVVVEVGQLLGSSQFHTQTHKFITKTLVVLVKFVVLATRLSG